MRGAARGAKVAAAEARKVRRCMGLAPGGGGPWSCDWCAAARGFRRKKKGKDSTRRARSRQGDTEGACLLRASAASVNSVLNPCLRWWCRGGWSGDPHQDAGYSAAELAGFGEAVGGQAAGLGAFAEPVAQG